MEKSYWCSTSSVSNYLKQNTTVSQEELLFYHLGSRHYAVYRRDLTIGDLPTLDHFFLGIYILPKNPNAKDLFEFNNNPVTEMELKVTKDDYNRFRQMRTTRKVTVTTYKTNKDDLIKVVSSGNFKNGTYQHKTALITINSGIAIDYYTSNYKEAKDLTIRDVFNVDLT